MSSRGGVIIGAVGVLLLGLVFAAGYLIADDADRVSELEDDLAAANEQIDSTDALFRELAITQAAPESPPNQADPFPGPAAGAGGEGWNSLFPPVQEDPAGPPFAPVKSNAEAETLCEAAHRLWPRKYGLYSQIRFAAPNSDDDLYCQR